MTRTVKTFALMILLFALSLPLAACNTIEGIGRDTRAAGDAITGAAHETKSY